MTSKNNVVFCRPLPGHASNVVRASCSESFVEIVEDNSRLAAHTTKLRSISEIEHDAKRALNAKKSQIRADLFRQGIKGVGVSRHMLHYDSVKRIVGEMDEEKEAELQLEKQRRREKRRRQKAILKLKQQQLEAGAGSPETLGEEILSPGGLSMSDQLEIDMAFIDELSISVDDNDEDSFHEEAFAAEFDLKSPAMSRAVSAVGTGLTSSRPSSAPMLKSPGLSSPNLCRQNSMVSRQNSLLSPNVAGNDADGQVTSPMPGTPKKPTSAGRRRSSVMGSGQVDPRLLQIQQMKLRQEEEAKQALMKRIIEKEQKMLDNIKYADKRAHITQWLRVVATTSRMQ